MYSMLAWLVCEYIRTTCETGSPQWWAAALIRNNPSHVCCNYTEIFSAIIGNIRSNYLLYFLQCLINWQIIDFRLYVQYTFSEFNVAIICNQHYNSTKLSHNFLSLHDFPAGSAWKKHCNSSWPKMLELRPKYTAVFIIGSRLARLYRTMHAWFIQLSFQDQLYYMYNTITTQFLFDSQTSGSPNVQCWKLEISSYSIWQYCCKCHHTHLMFATAKQLLSQCLYNVV